MTLESLIEAVRSNPAADSFHPRFDNQQWRAFALALAPVRFRMGQVLIRAGSQDPVAYFIGSGNVQQYMPSDRPGSLVRASLVRPGSVVGERALFSDAPHPGHVEAISQVDAFALSRARFQELSLRQPALAVETLRALGAVMIERQPTGRQSLPLAA